MKTYLEYSFKENLIKAFPKKSFDALYPYFNKEIFKFIIETYFENAIKSNKNFDDSTSFEIILELRNNLKMLANILKSIDKNQITDDRDAAIKDLFCIIVRATLNDEKKILEFIFNLTAFLKLWQIGEMNKSKLIRLISLYYENIESVLIPVENIADHFTWQDFDKDPFSKLFSVLFINVKFPAIILDRFDILNDSDIKFVTNIIVRKDITKCLSWYFPFTKKAAYVLTEMQSDFFGKNFATVSFSDCLMFAQAIAMGADSTIAFEFIKSRTEFNRRNIRFWKNVLQFFINQKATADDILPLMDYIHMRYKKETSKFSLKGRTLKALKIDMYEWHEELRTIREREITEYNRRRILSLQNDTTFYLEWAGTAMSDFNYELNEEKYIIKQLFSAKELSDEGTAMNHCVYSYANSCVLGFCSIWSLRLINSDLSFNRLLTIELRDKTIIQIKGKFNSAPVPKYMQIINNWMKSKGLITI